MLRSLLVSTAIAAASLATSAQAALVQVWLDQPGIGANATLANKPATAPDITFNSGAINYDSRVNGYTIDGFFNSPTYITGAGFANHDLNNIYVYITGQTFLQAGDNNFVVPHDDGLELNIDGIGIVLSQPGPTAPTDSPFNVNAPSAGLYGFELSYGEVFGPPAVLGFTINDQPVGGVPDAATWAMLIAGFGLVGATARRRRQASVAA